MKESLDLHVWGLRLIPPGRTKILDGHSWQPPPPKLPGSVATRSGTQLSICVPFTNANKESHNVRQEVVIFRSTKEVWLSLRRLLGALHVLELISAFADVSNYFYTLTHA